MARASPHKADEAEQFLLDDTDDDQPQSIAGAAHSRQCLLNSDDEASYEEDDIQRELSMSQAAMSMSQRRHKKRSMGLALLGSATFLGCIVAFVHGSKPISNADKAVKKFSVIDNAQPRWQIVTKERELCSGVSDNCFQTKCCNIAGYKCYEQSAAVAQCMKSCDVGIDSPTCALAKVPIEFDEKPATSLFCFSVYTQNTGSTKKSYERELLTQQHAERASIFACDSFAVYSDVNVSLGGGFSTIKVDDVEDDFHFAKRRTTGAWVNTGMFKQVWMQIGQAGEYIRHDWTVKVDPDAVFLPHRLVQRIALIPRPENGIFLVNCKHVDNGFFGNLEVFSSMAFSILIANIQRCDRDIDWKVGIENGKYGPMGEDLFAQTCMEKNGVSKSEAFDITIDGACPADRPRNFLENKHWRANCKDVSSAAAMHPFKKPYDYFHCLKATEATVL